MITTRIILAIIIAATITSCCNMKSVTSLAQINGEWNVTEIEGKGLPESDSKPFIGFDAEKKSIYGYTGCNRLTGSISSIGNNGAIDLSHTGSTRMMCPDMSVEQDILTTLSKVTICKTEKNTLLFCDKDGKTVMKLEKR